MVPTLYQNTCQALCLDYGDSVPPKLKPSGRKPVVVTMEIIGPSLPYRAAVVSACVCVCAYSVMKPRVPDMRRPKEEFLEVEEEGRVCVCV